MDAMWSSSYHPPMPLPMSSRAAQGKTTALERRAVPVVAVLVDGVRKVVQVALAALRDKVGRVVPADPVVPARKAVLRMGRRQRECL